MNVNPRISQECVSFDCIHLFKFNNGNTGTVKLFKINDESIRDVVPVSLLLTFT